jgi:hypothetical protein
MTTSSFYDHDEGIWLCPEDAEIRELWQTQQIDFVAHGNRWDYIEARHVSHGIVCCAECGEELFEVEEERIAGDGEESEERMEW